MFTREPPSQACGARDRRVAKQPPIGQLVDPAGAPGVTAHDPPYGEDRSPDHSELAHRLHGVAGAARVIAAARLEIGRDQPPVGVQGQQERLPEQAGGRGDRGFGAFHVLRRRPESRFGDQFPQRAVDSGSSLTLNQTSNVGSGDQHVVVIRRQTAIDALEGLAQGTLDGVSLYGPANPAPNRDPEAQLLGGCVVSGAWERVQDQVAVRVRTAVSEDAIEVAAAGQAPALSPLTHQIGRAVSGRRDTAGHIATESGACGPWRGGGGLSLARSACASGHGTREYGPACASSAARCASSDRPVYRRRSGTPPRPPGRGPDLF